MEINDIERFVVAQERDYSLALSEIKAGKKTSHWMWYIFPQLRGLGQSRMSYIYGINGIDEARAYMAHPTLSANLIQITEALLVHKDKSATEIFGYIDDEKLLSSMTLFSLVSEDGSVFHQVLDAFFDGERDSVTIKMVGM